jgi:predicted solute-binding protein
VSGTLVEMTSCSNVFGTHRVGAVSYLNTLPLIDGLEQTENVEVVLGVPSRLAAGLETGETDVALCPVIDCQRSTTELELVPVGLIGSHGHTHTVVLFSQRPFEEIDAISCDVDSHTSHVLLKVIMKLTYGRTPQLEPFDTTGDADRPAAVMLIGDKVVSRVPSRETHPYRLDLGEAWLALTGRPFVFGAWFCRRDRDGADRRRIQNLAVLLDHRRRANRGRIDSIVATHAAAHGWAVEDARRYLCETLQFDPTPERLDGMHHFFDLAAKVGAIDAVRPLAIASMT